MWSVKTNTSLNISIITIVLSDPYTPNTITFLHLFHLSYLFPFSLFSVPAEIPEFSVLIRDSRGLAVSLPFCVDLQGVPRLLPEEKWMPREKLVQVGRWHPALRARRWPMRWRNCPCSPARTYHLLTSARTVSPLHTRCPGAGENVHARSHYRGTNIGTNVQPFRYW